MESANIHHQLQDQLVGSSSLSTIPSYYGVGNITHAWSTPNSFLNTNGLMISSYPNQENLNPREARHQGNTLLSSQNNSMAPDLGLIPWANNSSGSFITSNNHEFAQDLHVSRIKEEMADHYYLKYNEMLSSCPSSSTDIDLTSLKNEQRNLPYNDIGMKLFLNSFSCGDLCPNSFSNGTKGRGLSHQIFPTINISNLSQMGLTNPGSLDMNLQALDLLTSSRFSENFSSSLQNQIGLLRDGFSYGFDQMQQSHQKPVCSSNKITLAPSSGGAETKRSSNKMEHPKTLQNAQKKSRLDGRAACPPFKVRKEKLGDRIASLQQLVSPFGKTDTASVLMEAIGYIKFLENQVETLSVPYMKESRNNTRKIIKESDGDRNEREDAKRDLKSRGLCLVPLSCLSYITDGGSATVWPPAHFSSGAAAT